MIPFLWMDSPLLLHLWDADDAQYRCTLSDSTQKTYGCPQVMTLVDLNGQHTLQNIGSVARQESPLRAAQCSDVGCCSFNCNPSPVLCCILLVLHHVPIENIAAGHFAFNVFCGSASCGSKPILCVIEPVVHLCCCCVDHVDVCRPH